MDSLHTSARAPKGALRCGKNEALQDEQNRTADGISSSALKQLDTGEIHRFGQIEIYSMSREVIS
jgi:hypothetical protein